MVKDIYDDDQSSQNIKCDLQKVCKLIYLIDENDKNNSEEISKLRSELGDYTNRISDKDDRFKRVVDESSCSCEDHSTCSCSGCVSMTISETSETTETTETSETSETSKTSETETQESLSSEAIEIVSYDTDTSVDSACSCKRCVQKNAKSQHRDTKSISDNSFETDPSCSSNDATYLQETCTNSDLTTETTCSCSNCKTIDDSPTSYETIDEKSDIQHEFNEFKREVMKLIREINDRIDSKKSVINNIANNNNNKSRYLNRRF